MKIGVTVFFQHSYFSAGAPQTALALGDVLRLQDHTVHLLHVGPKETTWWEDVKGLEKEWVVKHVSDLHENSYDIIFEVGKHMLEVEQRKAAKRCVWFCRKIPLLSDIEESLFSGHAKGRSMEGITEVWVPEEQATEDDVQYLEVQTRRSVRRVPFVWTPAPLEAHRSEKQSPVWQQVAQLPEVKEKPFDIHICETNNSAGSSCYIPMFIAKEAKKKWSSDIQTELKIHNADHIKNVEFFKHNVYSKVVESDVSGSFLARMRSIDFVYMPMSLIIAHSRFQQYRPYLFDLLWVGVPLVHNSLFLRDRLGLLEGYYSNNDILEGRDAVGRVMKSNRNATLEDLFSLRKKLFSEITPNSSKIQGGYTKALLDLLNTTPSFLTSTLTSTNENVFRVGFSDMWENFQTDYNPFTLMLQASLANKTVKGVDMNVSNEKVDVLVFGPFGDRWRSIDPSVPKVHYTGENSKPIQHPDVKLNLGFEHRTDEHYIRLPLWMLEINWFRADVNRLVNPKPVSIDACCQDLAKPNPSKVQDDLEKRTKFCAFVVSNPCNSIRNNSFHWLSKYKKVDSAGRLYNNTGPDIFAGLGGGGGELKKVDFFKQYKFALTFENASSPGYTTEKMFHAKVGGCVPIYWGDPEVEQDFDVRGFIDARKIKSEQELIDLVKEVDNNDALWKEKTSIPALDPERRDRVRRTLATVAKRILELGGVKGDVPEMIGYVSDTETIVEVEEISSKSTSIVQELVVQPATQTIFVSGANLKFIPALQVLLQTIHVQRQMLKGIKGVVYLMKDISVEVETQLKQQFDFVEFRRFPEEGAYTDIWEPQHFAWKLYILQQIVQEKEFEGVPMVYVDAGVMLSRWPESFIQKARDKGIVLLEDPRQENRRWCHMDFCKQLKVSDEELSRQQIWAGSIAFVGGAKPAKDLFVEAWKWAQVRDVIVGAKWSGMDDKGRPMGHRHDQSILSLLSQRMGTSRMPLDDVYGDISLRQTFLKGQSLYAHRGNVKVHQPLLEGIDDVWVINLDRRQDRLDKFMKTNQTIADRVLRIPAFDGKTLPLTPRIARLFAPHDFKWKKSVMGCALSHLAMWMKLLTDKPDIQSYLICEDDAVLDPAWKTKWESMMKNKGLPDDWDVVYLGGVLPPNRAGFESVVEKVNDYVGRVKENTIFGQPVANCYFHFCAYAYVLSRRGAQKIVDVLKAKGGYWTSADHMICNIQEILRIYFMHPLVAGCFQDNDPVYQQSAFNDFSRVDKFDSDLWNNTEQFTQDEVLEVMKKADKELDVLGALEDARQVEVVDVIGKEKVEEARQELLEIQKHPRRLVSVAGEPIEAKNLYEYHWLKYVLGRDFTIEQVKESDDVPIVLVQGVHMARQTQDILRAWKEKGKRFYILHLSDEFAQDPIEMYAWAEGVIRNYNRDDVKESDKVKVIPLGYHWSKEENPFTARSRDLLWSFVGTKWKGREEKMKICEQIPGPHKLVLMDTWNSPSAVPKEEMIALLEKSLCIPCPVGNNKETFRFYEALEAGAVPIVVKEEGMEKWMEWVSPWMKILPCENWLHAAQLIYTLKEKPEVYEQYKAQLLHGWIRMKKEIKEKVHEVLHLSH
jgi:GR25 family glycosyltransferase involved in LPS biosynthesis